MENPFLDKTYKEAKEYYRLSGLESDIKQALIEARIEPGLSIKSIARVVKLALKEDAQSLGKELLN